MRGLISELQTMWGGGDASFFIPDATEFVSKAEDGHHHGGERHGHSIGSGEARPYVG